MWLAVATALFLLLTPSLPFLNYMRAQPRSQTRSQPQATEDARTAFEKGEAAFKLNRFAQALSFYSMAHDKSGFSEILFNIGQCHRNLRNYEAAATAFRAYLDANPDSTKRSAVEALLADLDSYRLSPTPQAHTPPDAPPGKEQAGKEQTGIEQPSSEQARANNLMNDPTGNPTGDVTGDTNNEMINDPTYKKPFYKTWWFWTTVGVVTLGAAAGGVYLYTQTNEASNYDHIWPIP